jgi:hypothetical protein
VTWLVKESMVGFMGQVLLLVLWQGKELGVGRGGRGNRLVWTRMLGGWRKVTKGAVKKFMSKEIRREDVVIFFEDAPQIMKTRVVSGDYGTCGFGFV